MADTSARRRRGGSGKGRVLVLALLSLLASGCATKGDLRDVQTDLRSVNARLEVLLEAMERQNRMSLDTLSRQRSQIVDFQGTVMNQLREILDELSRIQSLAGANATAINQIEDQLAEIRYALRTGSAIGRGGTAGMGGEEDVGSTGGASGPEDELYESSQEYFNRGSWSAASAGFQTLLDQYPNGRLAPLALLRLGQIAEEREQFQEAISLYQEVQERFPRAEEVPRAMYLTGIVYLDHLENEDRGRATLQRLINTYDASEYAELARERLRGGGSAPL